MLPSIVRTIVPVHFDPKRPQGGTTRGAGDDVRIVEAALRKEGLLPAEYDR